MAAIWTTPILWTDEIPISVEKLNQYIGQDGNLDYLYRAPQKVLRLGGSDYASTTTSFADIDATNLILTITPKNGRVTVMAIGNWRITNSAPNSTYMDWIVDSTTRAGDATYGSHSHSWTISEDTSKVNHPFFCLAHFTGLTNAAHTFKLQWKCSGGGVNMSIYNTTDPILLFGGQD